MKVGNQSVGDGATATFSLLLREKVDFAEQKTDEVLRCKRDKYFVGDGAPRRPVLAIRKVMPRLHQGSLV